MSTSTNDHCGHNAIFHPLAELEPIEERSCAAGYETPVYLGSDESGQPVIKTLKVSFKDGGSES
jgi:hypothetical protein